MDEFSVLRTVLQRRRCSVPRLAQHWLYFKHHVLEKDDVRARFQHQALDRTAFRELLVALADPRLCGPRYCRTGHRATIQRSTRELVAAAYRFYRALLHPDSRLDVRRSDVAVGGLGLFARSDLQLQRGQYSPWPELFGLALTISRAEFQALVEAGYPSLLGGPRRRCLLVGPLSLVNHECSSSLCLDKLVACAGTSEEFGEAFRIGVVARRELKIAASSELLVDYFNLPSRAARPAEVGGRPCMCPTCRCRRSIGRRMPENIGAAREL